MITLDLSGRLPIYEQICKGISELIAKGVLKENDKLPGARTLAQELSLNPNTVAKAYSRLEHDRIIYSVQGKGCFVAKQQGVIEKNLLEEFSQAAEKAMAAGITVEKLTRQLSEIEQKKKSRTEGEQ